MSAQGFGMLKKAYVKVMSGTFDHKQWPQPMKAFNPHGVLKVCSETGVSCLKLRNSIALENAFLEIT